MSDSIRPSSGEYDPPPASVPLRAEEPRAHAGLTLNPPTIHIVNHTHDAEGNPLPPPPSPSFEE